MIHPPRNGWLGKRKPEAKSKPERVSLFQPGLGGEQKPPERDCCARRQPGEPCCKKR